MWKESKKGSDFISDSCQCLENEDRNGGLIKMSLFTRSRESKKTIGHIKKLDNANCNINKTPTHTLMHMIAKDEYLPSSCTDSSNSFLGVPCVDHT